MRAARAHLQIERYLRPILHCGRQWLSGQRWLTGRFEASSFAMGSSPPRECIWHAQRRRAAKGRAAQSDEEAGFGLRSCSRSGCKP
eukprot:6201142-Pleurochrysis_carterae.AAC.1